MPWAIDSDLMLSVQCRHEKNTDNNLGRGDCACLFDLICLTNTEYKHQSRNNFICKQTFRHSVLTIFTVLSNPMHLNPTIPSSTSTRHADDRDNPAKTQIIDSTVPVHSYD